MSEKPPIVYGFCRPGACDKCEFPVAPVFVPAYKQRRVDSGEAVVTTAKQSFRILSFCSFCNPSILRRSGRNLCRLEFVQLMTNIRLGSGRGFRYACSQLPIVVWTPEGVGPHAREDAFVEASTTPRLAVSATGEKEWAI